MEYELIRYFDLFGSKFNFYLEKRRKLYTILGGLLSIICIILCIVFFITLTIDDFKRIKPNVSTSAIPSQGYHKVKFGEEKIWIPWRIRDYQAKFVNHTGILYPKIYYYYGEKKDPSEGLNLKYDILQYKLCNETSMANESEKYQINIPLDKLFCIDMDDLIIGGSLMTNFVYYIELDLYLCQDGKEYDENDERCSTQEKLKEKMGENNSWLAEFFYPVVQFQPTNIKKPILVIYREHFYHLSTSSNKIERIYLQEHVLNDDLGWVSKKSQNFTTWGFSSISGDSYFSSKKEMMNEGSSSRIYSFNIYLEPGIIFYQRSYKKFFQILGETLPVINIIYLIFKQIAKTLKVSDGNKKLTELLFVDEEKSNLRKKIDTLKRVNEYYKVKEMKKMSMRNLKAPQPFSNNKLKKGSTLIDISVNQLSQLNLKNDYSTFHSNNKILKTNPLGLSPKNRRDRRISAFNFQKNILRHNLKSNRNIINLNYSSFQIHKKNPTFKEKKIIHKILFPYKYYLLSICLKNMDINKKKNLFSLRFINVYNFMSQLFDITSYVLLQKEFSILKNSFLDEQKIKIIEEKRKINVNDEEFYKKIKRYIDEQKLDIFSKTPIAFGGRVVTFK